MDTRSGAQVCSAQSVDRSVEITASKLYTQKCGSQKLIIIVEIVDQCELRLALIDLKFRLAHATPLFETFANVEQNTFCCSLTQKT